MPLKPESVRRLLSTVQLPAKGTDEVSLLVSHLRSSSEAGLSSLGLVRVVLSHLSSPTGSVKLADAPVFFLASDEGTARILDADEHLGAFGLFSGIGAI